MLHFILGPSGSGKSYQMLAELRTRAERGERSILIVPEQFTSSTEGVLYRTLGDSLSAYVDSYSFTSLSEALLRRYGGAAVPTRCWTRSSTTAASAAARPSVRRPPRRSAS